MKKFTPYIAKGMQFSEAALAEHKFVPTRPSEMVSEGFVLPDPTHDDRMAVPIAGGQFMVMTYSIEKRTVPKAAIDQLVDEKAFKIEGATGRKPGRKERKMLAEDALQELLPRAFPKQIEFPILAMPGIFGQSWLVMLGTTSQDCIDRAITGLVNAFSGTAFFSPATVLSPRRYMTDALLDHSSDSAFSIGRECQLRSEDEEQAMVTFQNHSLEGMQIVEHIREGKLPISLCLTWSDRLELRLHDNLRIDRIKLLDIEPHEDEENLFQADWTIMGSELRDMFNVLLSELGGLQEEKVDAKE